MAIIALALKHGKDAAAVTGSAYSFPLCGEAQSTKHIFNTFETKAANNSRQNCGRLPRACSLLQIVSCDRWNN